MILLDTNALIWAVGDDPALGKQSRSAIETAGSREAAHVSVISFWEVAMLIDEGRLNLDLDLSDWTAAIVASPAFRIEAVTAPVAIDAGRLPGNIHANPADRLIIATARRLDFPIVTSDGLILRYAKDGHVKAIDARR